MLLLWAGSRLVQRSFVWARDYDEDLQSALDATAAGGVLQLTPGHVYRPPVPATFSTPNLELRGGGGTGQFKAVGVGSTQVVSPDAGYGLIFNPAATMTVFQGPVIDGVTFVGNCDAAGGLLIKRTNNWRLIDSAAVGFMEGVGFDSDGTGNVNQYWWMDRCGAYDCKIGVRLTESGGGMMRGLVIDPNSNEVTTPRPGTTGIQNVSGGTNMLAQSVIQGADIAIDYQWDSVNNVGHDVAGVRMECVNTGIRCVRVCDSSFRFQLNNATAGTIGTAISLDANSHENTVRIGTQAVATPFTDAGVGNMIVNNGQLNFGSVTLTNPASGQLYVNNNLYVNSAIVLDQHNTSAPLIFGSAQDVKLYRAVDPTTGKRQLVARLGAGAPVVLAVEP